MNYGDREENIISMQGTHVRTPADLFFAGYFTYLKEGYKQVAFAFACPGCGALNQVSLVSDNDTHWRTKKRGKRPTFVNSFHHSAPYRHKTTRQIVDDCCGWHGKLTDGFFMHSHDSRNRKS